ncbi:uncharacterized protein L969DRAFT_92391 [Mixia osmundae IAM 14324]|uniref:Uncharacterized protein n=1 Tax=Mixia osmundae (strain CBS 9802 / IAM 14324 / JCM 22182 / KY 12970) TaxID=764103 RepID=G7DXP0_MIXOS|nr:uncharacterized protein L969DRAFT_92391 [Mixia osmundae IAM 14324]KEI41158.1 hypothetical protein L969DRAFT_92391 [Mixia osmundae IAM 14324]GAA95350.1 hypothetical protein E5Q_02006 [Mixia osmundae IAM 14324]
MATYTLSTIHTNLVVLPQTLPMLSLPVFLFLLGLTHAAPPPPSFAVSKAVPQKWPQTWEIKLSISASDADEAVTRDEAQSLAIETFTVRVTAQMFVRSLAFDPVIITRLRNVRPMIRRDTSVITPDANYVWFRLFMDIEGAPVLTPWGPPLLNCCKLRLHNNFGLLLQELTCRRLKFSANEMLVQCAMPIGQPVPPATSPSKPKIYRLCDFASTVSRPVTGTFWNVRIQLHAVHHDERTLRFVLAFATRRPDLTMTVHLGEPYRLADDRVARFSYTIKFEGFNQPI